MVPTNPVRVVPLTGGPGDGKTELLRAIAQDPALASCVAAVEEAIHGIKFVRLNPRSAEFQCALVAIQAATEQTVMRVLANTDKRILLTHRGTLDPCAFWQSFGNSRESFFEMTGTTLDDHYRRYDWVLHLESAAVRVPTAYRRYPLAHRPEHIAEAARLDQYLGELWSGHPRYVKINGTRDFAEKLEHGLGLVRQILSSEA